MEAVLVHFGILLVSDLYLLCFWRWNRMASFTSLRDFHTVWTVFHFSFWISKPFCFWALEFFNVLL